MFTPQGKGWSVWPVTPTGNTRKSGSGPGTGSAENLNLNTNSRDASAGKGMVLAFAENADSRSEFNHATPDRETLIEKIKKLENELFEYQYNMGLLLIEKKEVSSKYEELRLALTDIEDALKQEKAAHSSAISEAEKREENLRRILGVEKQCVHDLEKSLHDLRLEYAEIKFSSESKLAEANALFASIEKKSLEIEERFQATNARHAEVSRMSIETEKKRQEMEAVQKELKRERLSFNTEREAKELALLAQKEELRLWERKLHEGEERLAEDWRILNQTEERANNNDKILKDKESSLHEAKKKIEMANLTLKKKEEDITSRVVALALKEKEADTIKKVLETKEKELLVFEEKLNSREKVGMQKLLDEHNAILGAKRHEFEWELDQKRKSADHDLKAKAVELEKKEIEILHSEEKVRKREQILEKKLEKNKEKEKEFESKSNAQKEREKSIRTEAKKLELEKKEVLLEKGNLLNLKGEIEKIKADIEVLRSKVCAEKDQLKVSEEERVEFTRLQSELKHEIDNWRRQKELLLKESEDLKQDRLNFERQWDELDEKRAELMKDLESINGQKKKLENWKRSEEEKLKNEKAEMQDYMQRELEALKLAKETFAASVEQEKSALAEKTQSENSRLQNDLEMRKNELETAVQKKKEEMENHQREREKLFEEERDTELNNIKYLRQVAEREMEEMRLERLRLEKDREEAATNKRHLEGQRLEIRKDIDDLVFLSGKLRDQREQLIEERGRFIAFVENQRSCQSCGELINKFVISDINAEVENAEIIPIRRLDNDYLREGDLGKQSEEISAAAVELGSSSARTVSWLQKCTSIFKFSPTKMLEPVSSVEISADEAPQSSNEVIVKELSKEPSSINSGPELSFGVANESSDMQRFQSDSSTREKADQLQSIDDQSNASKDVEAVCDFQDHEKGHRGKVGKRGKARDGGTWSVKAIVEEPGESEHRNGNDEIVEEFGVTDGALKHVRKRNRAHVTETTVSDHGGSEGHSGSVLKGQSKKRRQRVAPPVQTDGAKRYNLRRQRIPSRFAAPLRNREKAGVDGGGDTPDARAAPSEATGENAGDIEKVEADGGGDAPDSIAAPSEATGENDDGNTHVQLEKGERLALSEAEDSAGTDEFRSESSGEDDLEGADEDEDVDDDGERLGQASIKKKLWKFLMT